MKKLINTFVIIAVIFSATSIAPLAKVQAKKPKVTFEDGLIAGQHTKVGDVEVSDDDNFLYIKFSTVNDFCLTETHLHIAENEEDIPQKNGNPIPGKFEYKEEHDCVKENTYEVPIAWAQGTQLAIAAHAEVCKAGKQNCESAWEAGIGFPGKNWATYFTYIVSGPKDWILPTDPIRMNIEQFPGLSNTYFDLNLWEVGTGYDIYDGVWTAWCADSHVYIYTNRNYNPSVYSSLDAELGNKCDYCSDDERWNYVNYILNHKDPEASWREIQAAIWYFTDEDPDYRGYWTSRSEAMIEDALANGSDFRPREGQFGAVILASGEDVQLVFLEVDP